MDKALEFITKQCADISAIDRHYFHQLFTSICIKDHESATNYLRGFTFGKAHAECANNKYTEAQLVDFAPAGLYNTKNMKNDTAFQLFLLEHDNGCTFTLEDIEKRSELMRKRPVRHPSVVLQ